MGGFPLAAVYAAEWIDKYGWHQNFLRIASDINVAPALADLGAHPELWGQIPNRTISPDSPHHESTDIWIRYGDIRPAIESGDWTSTREPHEAIWYPAYDALPSLGPIIEGLRERVEGKRIGGVWITRIPPGKGIRRHVDWGWHANTFDKFYAALQSDEGAVFGCERHGVIEEIETPPGTCYLMDNRHPHWVRNASTRDRYMLIVCIETAKFNAWHGRT
jgi:hypothetical protein